MTQEEIRQKLQQYEAEKLKLENNIKDIERNIIIKQERINQVKENLEKAYGTIDVNELNKIEEKLETEIQDLEAELQTLQVQQTTQGE